MRWVDKIVWPLIVQGRSFHLLKWLFRFMCIGGVALALLDHVPWLFAMAVFVIGDSLADEVERSWWRREAHLRAERARDNELAMDKLLDIPTIARRKHRDHLPS